MNSKENKRKIFMGSKLFLHIFQYDWMPEIPMVENVLQQLKSAFLEKSLSKAYMLLYDNCNTLNFVTLKA